MALSKEEQASFDQFQRETGELLKRFVFEGAVEPVKFDLPTGVVDLETGETSSRSTDK